MNGYNFTERVRTTLRMAREEAGRLRHDYVGTEHILLGLLKTGEGVGITALLRMGVDLQDLRASIDQSVKPGHSEAPPPAERPYTSRAKKVLELAMIEARELGHNYVGTEHLLLGLVREERGIAAQMLASVGIELEPLRGTFLALLGTTPGNRNLPGVIPTLRPATRVSAPAGTVPPNRLPKFSSALNTARTAIVLAVIALAISAAALYLALSGAKGR